MLTENIIYCISYQNIYSYRYQSRLEYTGFRKYRNSNSWKDTRSSLCDRGCNIVEGTVYDYNGTTKLENVLVSCAVTGNITRTLATGTDGKYSFSVHPDSVYKYLLRLTGYIFNPVFRNYTNPTASSLADNFKAEQQTVTITRQGCKEAEHQMELMMFTITVTGNPGATTTTKSGGYYSFTALVGQSYTVSPSKSGWTFSADIATGTITAATKFS